jgi:hypothetical protein
MVVRDALGKKNHRNQSRSQYNGGGGNHKNNDHGLLVEEDDEDDTIAQDLGDGMVGDLRVTDSTGCPLFDP